MQIRNDESFKACLSCKKLDKLDESLSKQQQQQQYSNCVCTSHEQDSDYQLT